MSHTIQDETELTTTVVVNQRAYTVPLDVADELTKLRTRLEIDPRHPYDGISTRDATIKVLEEQLHEANGRLYMAGLSGRMSEVQ